MEKRRVTLLKCPVCNRIKKHGEWIKWSELTPEEFAELAYLHDAKLIDIMSCNCPKH